MNWAGRILVLRILFFWSCLVPRFSDRALSQARGGLAQAWAGLEPGLGWARLGRAGPRLGLGGSRSFQVFVRP